MTDDSRVDQLSAAVTAMAEPWPMIEALVGGTDAMRKAGKRFLPQWPKEPDDSYAKRLSTAVLFDAFAHTAVIMAAKPFTRPINFKTEPPARVKALFEDVDRVGTDIQAFAHGLMHQCLTLGLTGVLVDYPDVEGVRTRADEKAAGVRPYFAVYPGTSILGWRTRQTESGVELDQLRLMETVTEPDGRFGETQIKQVRVLEPGFWELWRQDNKGGWRLYRAGATTLNKIPFVFFYGTRKALGIGKPPLLNLAHLNVEHWQSASDQQTILHVARVPILFASGFTDGDNLTIGAGTAVTSLNTEADLKYVEHSGAAIEAGRNELQDLERRMIMAGAEILRQRPAIVTATQVDAEGEVTRSPLQQIVEDFEDSLEVAVALLAEWLVEPFEPEIELFKDFGSQGLADMAGTLLLTAQQQGVVSRQTAFEQLQRMDVVDPSLEWDEEQKRLTEQRAADDTRDVEKQAALQETMQQGVSPAAKPPMR